MIVAVVGAGTIGLSWAALYASHGWDVRLVDPRPDLAELLAATVTELSAVLPADDWGPRIGLEADLEAAVAGADVVQENGPEVLAFKQDLFARIEVPPRPTRCCCPRRPG